MSETLTPTLIVLSETQAELALAETNAVQAAAAAKGYRARLARLAGAIESGSLDEDDALTLEPILELALQTGRIRAIYGPPGEQAALRLHRKLPAGRALRDATAEVSSALRALQGQRLEGATVSAVGPGTYTISLATDEGHLTIKLDRQGPRISSVEV